MRHGPRRTLALLTLGALLAGSTPAGAVEYRLQVVSLFETALLSFLKPGEIRDGASGPGLDQLAAALDLGRVAPGAVLWDRRVVPVPERPSAAWGAVAAPAVLLPAADGRVWDEVRWQGNPGEQTVWLLAPSGRHTQEMYRLAVKGTGPMRYYQPYGAAWDAKRQVAPKFPLGFLWFYEERGTLWSRYVSRSLDLDQAIGVVTGTNDNAFFPDSVYIVVRHAAEPTTYKAALGWRQREVDRESPSLKNPMR